MAQSCKWKKKGGMGQMDKEDIKEIIRKITNKLNGKESSILVYYIN